MNANRILLALFACSSMTLASAQTGTDDCASPDPIAGQGSFAFDNSTATTGVAGQVELACYIFVEHRVANDVWFSWTADATGVASISTCNSTVDTKLSAYPSFSCPGMWTSIGCDDDSCGLQSNLTFACTAGQTYAIQVGTYWNALGGTGVMDISIGSTPSNDDCSSPAPIAGQGSFPFDRDGATTAAAGQAEPLCAFGGSTAIDNDVWFSWTSDFTGIVTIATCNSDLATDTIVAAYPGSGCPTAGSALDCDDNSCMFGSIISFPVTTNSTYTIQVGSWGTLFPGGQGVLDIYQSGLLFGDDCSAPVPIAGQGRFEFNAFAATTGTEGQNETLCDLGMGRAITEDMWYEWTADATGPATVATCSGFLNGSVDTRIAAYPGGSCPTDGSALACDDNSCDLKSRITFDVVSGSTYLLQIGTSPLVANPNAQGMGMFEISIAAPPEPGVAFCFCDGLNTPCANPGATGNGCQNSASSGGANLSGSGVAALGADTVLLSATGLIPNQPGLYFQGVNAINSGQGVLFGDGLRCAGGSLVRLGVAMANSSGVSSTGGFSAPISVMGGVSAGDTRHYQLWYRDPVGTLCGSGFNLSNGYLINW